MTTIKEAIGLCEVFENVSLESKASLIHNASLQRLEKGEHLFWDKEHVLNLYMSVEGTFSLYKQNNLGEKKVVFLYGAGHMLNEGMLQDLPASISCEAFSNAQVLSIPIKVFIQIMSEDFALSKAVMDSMAMKIRRLYRQMKNTTGSVRSDKRIAAKLWKLSLDHGVPCEEGIRIDLDLTITYFADMLGSKRETVSRQMKQLVDLGLVIQGQNGLIIPKREQLMEYFKAP